MKKVLMIMLVLLAIGIISSSQTGSTTHDEKVKIVNTNIRTKQDTSSLRLEIIKQQQKSIDSLLITKKK